MCYHEFRSVFILFFHSFVCTYVYLTDPYGNECNLFVVIFLRLQRF
jgi:hypothetical protein